MVTFFHEIRLLLFYYTCNRLLMNSNFHSLIPVLGVSLVAGVGGIVEKYPTKTISITGFSQGLCVLCYLVSKLLNNIVLKTEQINHINLPNNASRIINQT